MCGIAGIINTSCKPVSFKTLKVMTDTLAHRGPDGEGHWIEENVGLGHRRLAIIDLSPAGHQPMISSDHRFVISYNGEIYNYKELRGELETAGYWFRSNTDSEVVLNALAHWGVGALSRFNGMFALSMWDRKERELLLARDRYGIKPLYYALQKNIFSFGSEKKAITSLLEFNRQLNPHALCEYLTFQNIFTDQTLIVDINLLPAGCYATFNTHNNSFKKIQYWDYTFSEPTSAKDPREYNEELNRLLRQAVSRQLVSDVELGAYLSGGMDSGTITSIATQSISNLKTFTCGFDMSSASGIELNFDEREKAEAMSSEFKTEQYEMVLKSGDMERCLRQLAWHIEEPRVGQSYPNFYAANLASKFVKVVLSGAGGDEMFGGYPWRYYRNVNSQSFENYIDQYYLYWQRLVNNSDLRQLLSPIKNQIEGLRTRDIFRDVFSEQDTDLNSPEDYINHSLYFEAKTFLHGLFVVEDKLSMAHSLETRVPFMDNDLVSFAMQCPVNLKLNNLIDVVDINENQLGNKKKDYFKKTNDGKQILRDVMSSFMSETITSREKQGFSAPDSSWFKGSSINFVRNILFNGDPLIYSVLDRKTVVRLVEEHFKGIQNRRLLIWSLLNLETYFNLNFNS